MTAAAAPDPVQLGRDFDARIRPLLQKYCYQCHGGDQEEGGISFADVKEGAASLRHRALWRRSAKQIRSGDMPPDDAKAQFTPADKEALLAWLGPAVDSLDFTPANRDPGPSLVRRLNRAEYDNTLRDLLGLPFDSAREVGMPDDGVVEGFDNTAASMTLSAALIEKYLAAADKALDAVFGPDESAGAGLDTGAAPKPRGNRPGGKPAGATADAQKARDALLFVQPGKDLAPRDAARQVLSAFVRRAYRRPVQAAEVDRLLPLFDAAQQAGKPFEQSIRAALKPVLVSPHFIYRVETDRPPQAGWVAAKVNDHELAVRLSYFLWSSMPDAELFALADKGQLADTQVLAAQVQRMLADPKARALTDNFGAQWLQLNKLATARPTTEFFPTFNTKLRQAMYDETATFFDRLRLEDRSIVELLDADYTFVNADLAKHYGIDGVSGTQMQRVQLKPDHRRGGLLGMASVLSLTSHTFRTSPTQRGKYVLEVIFGTPPPPPPANAGTLKDDGKKSKTGEIRTFRDQLAAHATQKSCASCHQKIDPLGFSLDNFDAIGAWRDSTKENPLDVSGVLPSGQKINGASELKKVLLDRKDDFVRNVAEQMLSYASGRKMDYHDEATLREIVTAMQEKDNRFGAMIQAIVASPTFQGRRGLGAH